MAYDQSELPHIGLTRKEIRKARRAKKAENQRKRRAAAKKHGKSWLKGKDYDHDDKRFESVKANRGNDGNGTKKEGNKTKRKKK